MMSELAQNLTLPRSDFSNSLLVALKLSQGVGSQDCQVPPQHIQHLFNPILVILIVFFQIKSAETLDPVQAGWGQSGWGHNQFLL